MKKKKGILGLVTLIFMILMIMPYGYAADLPVQKTLRVIKNLSGPVKVAADANGNIYVGEMNSKSVIKYSSNGDFLLSIKLQAAPTALKITDNGLLYIGQAGRIDVFNGDNYLYTISNISLPAAIDVTSNGEIYVLDAGEYNIKVLNPSGDIKSVIGDFLTFGSDLRDLAIDESNNEFYVLDRGAANGTAYVWRVQAFSLGGSTPLRSFSNYGFETEGKMTSASSLVIDEQRRLYIADNMQNIITVYDHTGAYIGTLFDTNTPYYNPVNLDYKNNRLYFASFLGNNVTVLGIDKYANLIVEPSIIGLNVQGANIYGDNNIRILNTGDGQLNWTASSSIEWLGLSQTSGSIRSKLDSYIGLTTKSNSIPVGKYNGNITFAYNGGTKTAGVIINVSGPPVLTLKPAVIDLKVKEGDAVITQNVYIELKNDLSNQLIWTASSDKTWLSVTPQTGMPNTITTATLTINTSGLTPGTYNGRISVTAGNISGDITLNITVAAVNRILVTTNNPVSTFTITGPATFTGNGVQWSVDDVPDGEYTIVYSDITGFKTPLSEKKSVSGGNQLTFTGNYQKDKNNNIVASLQGINDMTTVKILDETLAIRKEFNAFPGYIGGVDTAIGDIDGDGTNEIIAGLYNRYTYVGLYRQTGELIKKFAAFITGKGIRVASADLDGNGSAEIIVLNNATSEVRIFSYTNGDIVDTGVTLTAFADISGNHSITTGDIDGDGRKEIITSITAPDRTYLKVWKIDTEGGTGNWSANMVKEITLNTSRQKIRGCETYDSDGIKPDEIIVYDTSGMISVFNNDSTFKFRLLADDINDISVIDLQGDGSQEFVAGTIYGAVKIFDSNGTQNSIINVFSKKSLVRISTGDLGYREARQ